MNPSPTKMNAATSLLVWVLAASILLLPGSSLQKRFHCQITGATSSSCCCEAVAPTDLEADSCVKRRCCSAGAESPDSESFPTVAERDGCGCCDVTYERTAHDASQVDAQSKSESSGSGGFKVALHGASPIAAVAFGHTAIWSPPERVPRAGAGPPVYLLHCVFLI